MHSAAAMVTSTLSANRTGKVHSPVKRRMPITSKMTHSKPIATRTRTAIRRRVQMKRVL